MNRKLLLFTLSLCVFTYTQSILSQTSLFTEDFESAGALTSLDTNGPYIDWDNGIISGTDNRWWILDNTATNPAPNGTYALGISRNNPHTGGGVKPRYTNNSSENIGFHVNTIDATAYTQVTLDFSWFCIGESIWDYGEVAYSLDGTNWIAFANSGLYNGQGTFQTVAGLDISEVAGQVFYLGFYWVNDGSTSNNPSIVIDDIEVWGDNPPGPCTTVTNIANCGDTVNTTIASGNGFYSQTSCWGGGTPGNEAIYTFTPTTTGVYNINQANSFGYIDYFFKDSASPCNGTGWTCIEDLTGAETSVGFTLTAGITYYIMLDPEGTAGGNVEFSIVCPPTPPTNLDCDLATAIACGQTILNQTTAGTTGATANGTGCTMSDYGIWYYHQGTGNQTTFTVTPLGGFDPAMAISEGTCDASGNFTLINNIACEDGFGVETYTFTTTLNADYYIYVAHYSDTGTTTGGFDIDITCTPPNCVAGPGTGISTVGLPNLVVADTNGNNPVTVTCGAAANVDLEATYLQIGDPSSYSVNSIPYAPPYQYDCLSNGFAIFNDDEWSPDVSIGFDFCFYDNVTANAFNTLNMGANGVITFEPTAGGDDSGWDTDNNVPNAINAEDFFATYFFGNSIYGVHHDIDPGQGGEIAYQLITLDTGERALIASWHDVPMFSDNSILYTGMIVLYEHTNVIDIYIEEKNIDDNNVFPWNDGNAAVAIQRDATTGLAAPNRNTLNTNWTATNEAWRFTPTGGGLGSISSIIWYQGSATANGGTTTGLPVQDATDSDIINVTPVVDTFYTAEITYSFCDGTSLSVYEEIEVQVGNTKTWDGSTDGNWYDATNWTPSGVPTSSDCVIIPDATTTPNDAVADTNIGPPVPPATPALAGTLTVQANGYLEVDEGTNLVVTNWIDTTNGNGILNVKDSGSLIQVNDAANNSGEIYAQRSPKSNQAAVLNSEYVYWSSPVSNIVNNGDYNDIASVSPGTNAGFIWEWDTTVPGNGLGNHGDWYNAVGNMTIGKGYIIRGLTVPAMTIPTTPVTNVPANTTLFYGIPNNGVITQQITHGGYDDILGDPGYQGNSSTGVLAFENDDNWNLIGNPYPSAISANAFTNSNVGINGTVYLWPHTSVTNLIVDPFYDDFLYNYNANDYVEHNNTGSNPPGTNDLYIASGQAFFVLMNHATSSPSNVTFNNSMREVTANYDNDNFFGPFDLGNNRSSENDTVERHRIWLDLITSEDIANTLLVGYIEGATNQFDRLYDGYEFAGSSISFFSVNDHDLMSIQGRGLPFDDEDTVPLGIVVPENDTYRIAINTLDGLFENSDQDIFLEDTYTGLIHDLRASPYNFSSEVGSYKDRFILRYTNSLLDTPENEDDSGITIVSIDENIIVRSGSQPIKDIIIYDLLGRTIIDLENLNTLEYTISNLQLSKSVYIVKAELYNKTQKIKKVIH